MRIALLCSLVVPVVVGCQAPSPEEVAAAEAPLITYVGSGPVEWHTGMAPIALISAREGFCFLTALGGLFRNDVDTVRLEVDAQGLWTLHGNPQSTDFVKATAECASWSSFLVYGGGTAVPSAPSMATVTAASHCEDRCWGDTETTTIAVDQRFFCGLGGVAGGLFDSDGVGVATTAQSSASKWTVTAGATSLPVHHLQGWANCSTFGVGHPAVYFNRPNARTQYVWHSGDGSATIANKANAACFLTGVHGNFDSADAYVTLENGSDRWQLYGNGANVEARALCINNIQ